MRSIAARDAARFKKFANIGAGVSSGMDNARTGVNARTFVAAVSASVSRGDARSERNEISAMGRMIADTLACAASSSDARPDAISDTAVANRTCTSETTEDGTSTSHRRAIAAASARATVVGDAP